ncbi:membrane-spanning 4-domains subfamily A member 4D-like [Lates japonicus]|uniref:Membrane-spanning 4-domains subfamily A member 4D-like protein n=1 Tax=Lates japonicus TaxID=270547 RepID=A0AAD3N431_LATJO|nr:membrane-spanning 4-domains subfamily A member 4D-like protein [Lates japonicus]
MEGTEPATRGRTTAPDGNQGADSSVLMSSKPLHRFVKNEPRSLGIVILIFGCAELLMGFQLASETVQTSSRIYIPFWQGTLFLICGNLSIYTEIHPSKKMVTVCLAMYVVSLLGLVVSVGYRINCLADYRYLMYLARYEMEQPFGSYRVDQISGIEGVLFASSLCVSVLLIFLCTIARLALKSTHTQVIIQCVPAPPQTD